MLTINVSRRHLFLLVLAFVMIVPLAAYAGSVFDDVDDTDTHIDGITFMKDSGVSVGCDAANNYCPQDNVTRAQMGTFMYRLSGNDPATAPSVNADTVDGLDGADLQTSAFSTFNDGPIDTNFVVGREVITLDLPAGSFVIFAKAWIDHGSGVPVRAECTLSAGVDFDQARAGLDVNSSVLDTATVSMNVVHTFASPGTAVLECDEIESNADLRVWDAKITAIQVDSLSNAPG